MSLKNIGNGNKWPCYVLCSIVVYLLFDFLFGKNTTALDTSPVLLLALRPPSYSHVNIERQVIKIV